MEIADLVDGIIPLLLGVAMYYASLNQRDLKKKKKLKAASAIIVLVGILLIVINIGKKI